MFVLVPKCGGQSYKKAAQIFCDYYSKITGKIIDICYEPKDNEDMVVIGSEAVQNFVYYKMPGGLPVRCNTDDYCIISKEDNGRNLLFLAGGRGRSTIYSVYDFFERSAGCHYFWDGDIIQKKEEIDITDFNIVESPRFTYRAIRYFAHRGLGRFQAEHWDFDEWKREIDWICKSRLNMFMLRIGIDDLFQKAFPDVVSYPSNKEILPEATSGYNNRTTFWSLEYRGELQKKVMDYAFSCDLIHPEDCGTMTHWYSRTPHQFLEGIKPSFLSQTSKSQSEQTGLVWNIFDEKNIENYQKLTDTHIKEYGKPEIFHTIGLAERTYYDDRKANLDLKKYTYRKIMEYVSRKYNDAPLLIAAWDFFFALKPEEVREIVKIFNPEQNCILDYTVDLKAEDNNFEKWNIIGELPWIFGIFHAYEPQNHIHGDYEYITEKLKIADKDSFCKGMAFWPEVSHSDTLMLEYFKENAWKPSNRTIDEIAKDMCMKRYSENYGVMLAVWNSFLPVLKLPTKARMASFYDILDTNAIFLRLFQLDHERQPDCEKHWENIEDYDKRFDPYIKTLYETIISIPDELFENPFIHRDITDILKTVAMKKLQYRFIKLSFSIMRWYKGENEDENICSLLESNGKMLSLFADVLCLHNDNSMYHSFITLSKNRPVNPYFENALKDNVINWYCRTSAYEAVKGIYEKEYGVFKKWMTEQLDLCDRKTRNMENFAVEKERIFEEFKKTPLGEFHKCNKPSLKETVRKLQEIL